MNLAHLKRLLAIILEALQIFLAARVFSFSDIGWSMTGVCTGYVAHGAILKIGNLFNYFRYGSLIVANNGVAAHGRNSFDQPK